MRKERRRLVIALVIAVLLISSTGVAFSMLDIDPNPMDEKSEPVKIILQDDREPEDISLSVETIILQQPYIENVGDEDCYVRVKLEIPQINGQPLLQVGKYTTQGFQLLEYTESESNSVEYWELNGEYLYYRNRLTKNNANCKCKLNTSAKNF